MRNKKVKTVSVCKKGKKELKKYHPSFYYLLQAKYMIVYLSFSLKINLPPQCQSGFKPGDSCTNQLLSFTHQIYKSFDNGQEAQSGLPYLPLRQI